MQHLNDDKYKYDPVNPTPEPSTLDALNGNESLVSVVPSFLESDNTSSNKRSSSQSDLFKLEKHPSTKRELTPPPSPSSKQRAKRTSFVSSELNSFNNLSFSSETVQNKPEGFSNLYNLNRAREDSFNSQPSRISVLSSDNNRVPSASSFSKANQNSSSQLPQSHESIHSKNTEISFYIPPKKSQPLKKQQPSLFKNTVPGKNSNSEWKFSPGASKIKKDFSAINFSKLAGEHDISESKQLKTDTPAKAPVQSWKQLPDIWASITSKFQNSQPATQKADSPTINKKKGLNLSEWSNWESEFRNTVDPLSRSGVERFLKLAKTDFIHLRRKLVEQPLSSQLFAFPSNSQTPLKGDSVEKVMEFQDSVFSSFHPVLVDFVQASSLYGCCFSTFDTRLIAARLEEASEDNELLKSTQIGSIFSIISFMVGEKTKVLERGYFDPLTAHPDASGAFQFRTQLSHGSLHWLQNHFLQHVDFTLRKEISSDNSSICLGGQPDLHQRIDAYIQLKVSPSLARHTKAWAHLFYLFRAGLYKEAQEYLESQEALDINDANLSIPFQWMFCIFCTEERFLLPPEYRLELYEFYESLCEPNPYLKAILQMMTRTDIFNVDKSDIFKTQEDFLWWQFVLDQEDVRETPISSDSLTLNNIKQFITASNFSSDDLSYVKGLLLSQQFELAVAELAKIPQYLPVAVFLATCLAYYGLLGVPKDSAVGELGILVKGKLNIIQLWSQALPAVTSMTSNVLYYYSVLLWLPSVHYHTLSMDYCLDFMHATQEYKSFLLEPFEGFNVPLLELHYHSLGDKLSSFRERAFKEAANVCIAQNNDFELGFFFYWKLDQGRAGLKVLYDTLSKLLFTSFRDFIVNPSQAHNLDKMNQLVSVIEKLYSFCLADSVNFPSNILYDTKCQLVRFTEIFQSLSKRLLAPIHEKAITFNIFPFGESNDELKTWLELFESLDSSVKLILPYALLAIVQGLVHHYPDLLHTTLNAEYPTHRFVRTAAKLVTFCPSMFPEELMQGFSSIVDLCRT